MPIPAWREPSSAGRVAKAEIVVALVADLGDEDVGERMGLEQPADADVGLRVERRRVGGVEQRRGLQQRGRERGRLGEVEHVAGVHPAAADLDRLAAVSERRRMDDRVVEMGRAVRARGLVAVAVGVEEAEDRRDRRAARRHR